MLTTQWPKSPCHIHHMIALAFLSTPSCWKIGYPSFSLTFPSMITWLQNPLRSESPVPKFEKDNRFAHFGFSGLTGSGFPEEHFRTVKPENFACWPSATLKPNGSSPLGLLLNFPLKTGSSEALWTFCLNVLPLGR